MLLESLGQQASFKQVKFKIKSKIFILDSTTISFCLSLFDWARYKNCKGGSEKQAPGNTSYQKRSTISMNVLSASNLQTTERYTHVTKRGFAKLKSPLDSLFEGGNLNPIKVYRPKAPYIKALAAMHKNMTDKLLLIGLIICVGCTDKKDVSKPDLGQSKTELPNDTFQVSGQVILKEYLGEGGNLVTEEDKTYFETVDHKDFLIEINQKTLNHRLTDVPSYKLSISGFKSTSKKYDKLIWEIKNEGQKAIGVWGVFKKYFKTVDTGCCSTEDGYRLYDLETGKYFLSHSGELDYSHYPTWNYTGYQAGNSTTFDTNSAKEIIGNLYYIEIDANSDKTILTNYDIYCENCLEDVRFEHTPEFEIKPKGQLKDEGFFQQFNLFKDGQPITQLDTADYYLVLEYDTKLRVLTPIIDKGLILEGQLTTDSDLSRDLRIKSR